MNIDLIKGERGNVLLIVAVIMVVLFGIVALVVDVGMLYVERRAMVTAADAAVLAGSRELAMGGDINDAIKVARDFAEANGATLTDDISVETVTYNGKKFEALVATVGVNKEYVFAKLLGFDNQDVVARAVGTWGYPTSFHNILPIVCFNEEGEELPRNEVLLLVRHDEIASGNWGFLSVSSASKKEIKDILEGYPSNLFFEIDDQFNVSSLTSPGQANSIIKAVEERLRKAENPDTGVSRIGIIPIIEYMPGGGRTEVKIIGFAPYEILDVIKEVDIQNRIGTGSEHAYFPGMSLPREYCLDENGYVGNTAHAKGVIIGQFLEEHYIPSRYYLEISQDPELDFGVRTVKLIH